MTRAERERQQVEAFQRGYAHAQRGQAAAPEAGWPKSVEAWYHDGYKLGYLSKRDELAAEGKIAPVKEPPKRGKKR